MLEPGQPIGNYRIVQKLGEGGMGAVFEAVHQDIGRHVAIKVLHAQYSKDHQVAIRFLNEARGGISPRRARDPQSQGRDGEQVGGRGGHSRLRRARQSLPSHSARIAPLSAKARLASATSSAC